MVVAVLLYGVYLALKGKERGISNVDGTLLFLPSLSKEEEKRKG